MFIRNSRRHSFLIAFRKDGKELEKKIDNEVQDYMINLNKSLSEEGELFLNCLRENRNNLLAVVRDKDSKSNLERINHIFENVRDFTLSLDAKEKRSQRDKEYKDAMYGVADRAIKLGVHYHNMTGDITYRKQSKMLAIKLISKYETAFNLVTDEKINELDQEISDFENLYKYKIFEMVKGIKFKEIGVIETLDEFLALDKYLDDEGNLRLTLDTDKNNPEDVVTENFYKNIFNYRDLNRLAEQKGFIKVRQKGDHGIFKDEEGNTTVIPQGRRVGKGLSCKIQKTVNSSVIK